MPPGDGVESKESKEDSADEDGNDISRLSGNQLLVPAEIMINYGSHQYNSLDDEIVLGAGNIKQVDFENVGELVGMEEEQAESESEQDDTNYYLSSAKTPSIDLKWASCDIKEQDTSNKLDEIGTPLRLLEKNSDDTLIAEIVKFSNLYGQREKGDTDFLLKKEKFRLFLAFTFKWVPPATFIVKCIGMHPLIHL